VRWKSSQATLQVIPDPIRTLLSFLISSRLVLEEYIFPMIFMRTEFTFSLFLSVFCSSSSLMQTISGFV
jgi:hypothetical protein